MVYQFNAYDEWWFGLAKMNNRDSRFWTVWRIFVDVTALFNFFDINITKTDNFRLEFFF